MELFPVSSSTSTSSDSEYEDEIDESSDDEGEVMQNTNIQLNPFELPTSSGVSDWKLENGELVKDVLAQNTAKMVMWSKKRSKKDLNAYILSVLWYGMLFGFAKF